MASMATAPIAPDPPPSLTDEELFRRAVSQKYPDTPHYVFKFNSDTQLRSHFERSHSTILLGGGVGSGKTILHAHDLRERAKHETDQLGGIFTNTQTTLEKGVFVEIVKLFRALGMPDPKYGRRPPDSWFKQWKRDGIAIPALASYRNVLTTPEGVHVLCGTLSTLRAMHQFETIQFGWVRLEEAINNSLEAVSTIMERVRCLTGGATNPDCAKYHHHTAHLIFNPPRGAHKWLVPYLDQLEEAAKPYYHALREGDTCDGCFLEIEDETTPTGIVAIPREHGTEVDHQAWPLLQRGVGEAILIRSKTSDNTLNQDRGYKTRLAAKMSKGTARRRLDGEIIREIEGGAYADFSNDNLHPVAYDPDRVLYLTLDFNLEPRAAGFWHPLNPGEYPTENAGVGQHIGKFGEYFYAGEMSDRKFATELVRGGRGDGGDSQPRYRSEENRGLPPSCDDTCEPICRRGHWNGLKGHRARIIAFGDQRGTHRSSHGDNLESSWDIVDKVFRALGNYRKDLPEDQPSPRARVDAVNAKFCNALDLRSAWIDPRCEESIRDFQQVMWDDDGVSLREWRRGSLGTEWHRTHLSDGDGYFIHRKFPMGEETPQRSAQDLLPRIGGQGLTVPRRRHR
jgi:hypothetical protein